ncbi:MAG TPA: histone deacetylase [Solirubrobacteraceae bacterium]|nr:histone deacetylase [Solirubrobacteraceae bacterium]
MAPAPVFLSHSSSLRHETGGHPEQAARIVAIERELDARGWLGWERRESTPVPREVLEAVHAQGYVDAIEAFCAEGGGHIDADTIASRGSFDAALHAAGGALQAVDLLLDGSAPCAFSVHRPPGHHALPSRAMGFCLFNNVAVAAVSALARGCPRVMILDWDVHHGNGTNDIFYPSADVLFVSIHQSPLWPGSGGVAELGDGEGRGFTVNLPVPPGSGDREFVSLVRDVAVPLLGLYEPGLVLISAGYDAHASDPLAGCLVTDDGFAAMAALIRDAAAVAGAPVGLVLEGGYAQDALARSVAATMDVLGPAGGTPDVAPEVSPLARDAAARLAPWWPSLGGSAD